MGLVLYLYTGWDFGYIQRLQQAALYGVWAGLLCFLQNEPFRIRLSW